MTGAKFVCEIKFSKNELTSSVIQEVQEKIEKIKKPKNYTCIPVLIHVNGVSDAVIESDFFYKIIDFNACLDI